MNMGVEHSIMYAKCIYMTSFNAKSLIYLLTNLVDKHAATRWERIHAFLLGFTNILMSAKLRERHDI